MEIKCTVQELRELIENKKETPVAGTTDVMNKSEINTPQNILNGFILDFLATDGKHKVN